MIVVVVELTKKTIYTSWRKKIMGIVTKTVTECTCDICGLVCQPNESEIRVNVNGGDRDVAPAQVHGVLVFDQPYKCVNGIICKSCKIEWLRIYLELHDKQ